MNFMDNLYYYNSYLFLEEINKLRIYNLKIY